MMHEPCPDGFLKELNLNEDEWPLIRKALTHSSFSAWQEQCSSQHNERLEYLGDAVLELVISHYLYRSYPHLTEGELTRLRSNLVRESTLVQVADRLGLRKHLRLGKGTEPNPSILADALEAILGALFLSRGYGETRDMIYSWFQSTFEDLGRGTLISDFKTQMQEYTQEKYSIIPEYRIVAEEGPDHDKTFRAHLFLNGDFWSEGSGKTKKEAEQEAARGAFEQLRKEESGNNSRMGRN